jgi:hypothetical protein
MPTKGFPMSLLNRRQRAVAKTARSAVRAYGAVRHTQGRVAARRSRGSHGRLPLLLAAAAGGGAAVGFLAHPQTRRAASERTRALIHHESHGASNGAIDEPHAAPEGVERLPGGF